MSEPLAHAVAGGIGASVAMGLLYPLDQVRVLLQADDALSSEAKHCKNILEQTALIQDRYGSQALYRGVTPVLVSMGVSNFLYFYCSAALKVSASVRPLHLK